MLRLFSIIFLAFLVQLALPIEVKSETRNPIPVLVIESDSSEIVWQSIVDILWYKDKLYLIDNALSQAQIFSAKGEYLGLLAGEGDGPGDLRNPTSISVNNFGNVVICSQMFGKCEEYDGNSNSFLKSYTLHSLENEAVCIVFRVEWCNGSRYEYYLQQKIEGTTVLGDIRISRFDQNDSETILYHHLDKRDFKEWNEKTSVPFTKEAWDIDESGSLWCALNWEKPVLTNPETAQEKVLGTFLPLQRTKKEQEEIREELRGFGWIEEIVTWPTSRAVIAVKAGSEFRLLGQEAESADSDYLLCGRGFPNGQMAIHSPFPEKATKVYLLENGNIAFVYDEEKVFESTWGETVQGPCIVVAGYDI